MDGRIGIVVCSEDAGENRFLDFVHSDTAGNQFLTSAIPVPAGHKPFLYGGLHPFPEAAGGHDDDGAIFYTYSDDGVVAYWTTNKGDSWSTTEVFTPQDSYLNTLGNVATGYNVNEMTVAQVPGEARFIHMMRGADEKEFLVATSTDMRTLTGVRVSGIDNEGASLEVGAPPHLLVHEDYAYFIIPGRQNWVDHAPDREQALMFFKQDAHCRGAD